MGGRAKGGRGTGREQYLDIRVRKKGSCRVVGARKDDKPALVLPDGSNHCRHVNLCAVTVSCIHLLPQVTTTTSSTTNCVKSLYVNDSFFLFYRGCVNLE